MASGDVGERCAADSTEAKLWWIIGLARHVPHAPFSHVCRGAVKSLFSAEPFCASLGKPLQRSSEELSAGGRFIHE